LDVAGLAEVVDATALAFFDFFGLLGFGEAKIGNIISSDKL
jgi:hypothetical protein